MPWKRNRTCSGRMEDSTKLKIPQTRVLTVHKCGGAELGGLVGSESFHFCSPSRVTAHRLRPSSQSKLMRDSGRKA